MEADPKKRAKFQEKIKDIPRSKLVFIDESGIDHGIQKERAWAKKGQVVVGKRSGKHFLRTNIVAGLCNKKCIAPMCFSGSCNTEVFNTWVKDSLIKELEPGQVVVLDNATFHKSKHTEDLIKSVGCSLLFLPPYSPDFNPIEKFWAKMKQFIRQEIETFDNLFLSICAFFKDI